EVGLGMFWLVFVILSIIMAYIGKAWLAKDKDLPGGFWSILIASLIGVWLGDLIFANALWVLADVNIIGGIIFSLILIWLWTLVGGKGQA
ncbi:MAG TPA: hypothetical protein PKI30_08290, partial [Bacillota bacterium]|nr:hypothetical protein [Bacillota bacterium]